MCKAEERVTEPAEVANEQTEPVSAPVHPVETAKPIGVDPLPWLVQRLRQQSES